MFGNLANMVGGVLGDGPSVDPAAFQLSNQYTNQYGLGGGMADQYNNRQINPEMQNMLMAAANGSVPSAAQIQMQQGLQSAQAQAGGMATANANLNPMLGQRMGMQAQSNIALQGIGQMSALRANEQNAARGQAAQWLMQQRQQNDQMVQYFQSLGYSMDEAQMKANMALAQTNAGMQQQQNAALMSMGGTVIGGLVGGPVGAVAGHAIGGGMGGGGGGGMAQGGSADVGASNPNDLNSTYGTPNAPPGYYQ